MNSVCVCVGSLLVLRYMKSLFELAAAYRQPAHSYAVTNLGGDVWGKLFREKKRKKKRKRERKTIVPDCTLGVEACLLE